MLLPHGYEGQGPEHSSARPHRLLSLCSEDNMVVANLTTPANLFHMIRRQLTWDFRKPCFLLSPKSLLRHPKCVSTIGDLADGKFEGIIDDAIALKTVDRLVLCSGKIYYELLNRRAKETTVNIALVRIEQLFPLDKKGIIEIVKKYNAKEIVWVQEEPENMGAWSFILPKLRDYNIQLISRDESAATASGSTKDSQQKQQVIIDSVFNNIK